MIEELKNKPLEKQIKIINNKESLRKIMEKVSAPDFLKYIVNIVENENIEGKLSKLDINIKEIIKEDDSLYEYAVLLNNKEEFIPQIRKVIEELTDKDKIKQLMYKLDQNLFEDYLDEINLTARELGIDIDIDDEEFFKIIAEAINEDRNFLEYCIDNYCYIFTNLYDDINSLNKDTISKIIAAQAKEGKITIINKFNENQAKEHDKEIKNAIKDGYYHIEKNYEVNDAIKNNLEYVLLDLNTNFDLLDYIPPTVIEQIPNEYIENAIKNGYRIEKQTPEIIKNNPSYISIAIDYYKSSVLYTINSLVDILNEQGLTPENFEKACKLGYSFHKGKDMARRGETVTPKFILEKPKYLSILLSNRKKSHLINSDRDLYSFINSELSEEQFTYDIFKILLENSDYMDYFFKSAPKFIYKDQRIIKDLLLKNWNYIKSIPNEYVTPELLNSDIGNIIEKMLKEGDIYNKIDNDTPEIIRNNPHYISLALDNQHYNDYYIMQLVDILNEQGLTVDNFEKALNRGYRCTNYTPKFILTKTNYLKKLLEKDYHIVYIFEQVCNKMTKDSFTPDLLDLILEYKSKNPTNLSLSQLPNFIYENPENIKKICEQDYHNYKIIPYEYITSQIAHIILQNMYKQRETGLIIRNRNTNLFTSDCNIYMAIELLKYGNFNNLSIINNNVINSQEFTNEMKKLYPNLDYKMSTKELIEKIQQKEFDLSDNPMSIPLVRALAKYSKAISNDAVKKIVENSQYIEEYIIMMKYGTIGYKIVEQIPDNLINEDNIKKIIDSGYRIRSDSPKITRKFKFIKYAIYKGYQEDAFRYLDINSVTEKDQPELDSIIYKAIDNGYQINAYSPELLKQFNYIKHAIEKGQGNAFEYLDINSVAEKDEPELDSIIYKAIDNGYQIDGYSPELLKQFKYIKHAVEKGQGNAFEYLDINSVAGKDQPELENLIYKAIDNGYQIDGYSPKLLRQFKYIKYAVEKGQGNAFKYLDINSIAEKDHPELDSIIYKAIDNGYQINAYSPELLKQFKYIKYAVEKGQIDSLRYLDINSVTEKDHPELDNYIYNKIDNLQFMTEIIKANFDKMIIKKSISHYLGYDIEKINNYEDIINILRYRNEINKNELLFFTKYKELEQKGFNVEKIVRYTLCENPNFSYLNQVIENNELTEMISAYNKIQEKYYSDISPIEKYDLLMLVSRNYCKNRTLCNYAINNEMTETQKTGFYILFENNSQENIKVEDLEDFENSLRQNLINGLNNANDINNLKSVIIRYISDMDKNQFEKTITNHINTKTLDIIFRNTKNDELKEKVEQMQILLSFIEDIINIEDVNNLNDIINNIIKNTDDIIKIRLLYKNINKEIRDIYELEAQEELIDLTKIKKEENYIDLKDSKYAIYAHVYTGYDVKELINPRVYGRQTICLSPITELSQKFYTNGLILGYTIMPKGNFIGSSNQNMNSNTYIHSNSTNVKNISERFNQMPIRESSALSIGHPETLAWREGLIPTCIIISGEEPSTQELEAQKTLTEEIKKLAQDDKISLSQEIRNIIKDDDFKVELVKVKSKGLKLDETKKEQEKKSSSKVDFLKSLKNEIVGITNNSEIKQMSRINIGGSHILLQAKINNDYYIIKPALRKGGTMEQPFRAYALETGYNIQKLVNDIQKENNIPNQNPNSAVEVKVIKTKINDNGEKITCAALKNIIGTANYEHKDNSFTDKEINQFLKELIVDHLIFNYDTKRENFIYDSYLNVYGIDKEQALKFYNRFIKDDGTFDTSIKLDFNPNGVDLIYPQIFNKYINKEIEITEETIEECKKITEKINQISDKEYLKNFENYINTLKDYSTNEDVSQEIKKKLKESILARKNNLYKDFTIFIENIKSKRQGSVTR